MAMTMTSKECLTIEDVRRVLDQLKQNSDEPHMVLCTETTARERIGLIGEELENFIRDAKSDRGANYNDMCRVYIHMPTGFDSLPLRHEPLRAFECEACGEIAFWLTDDAVDGALMAVEHIVLPDGRRPFEDEEAVCQHCECNIDVNYLYMNCEANRSIPPVESDYQAINIKSSFELKEKVK